MAYAYIFRAALLCQHCGKVACQTVPKPAGMDPNNEASWDSDDYPKGPFIDGGGEADSPQHCDFCGEFLGNPLTPDGDRYVLDALREHAEHGRGDPAVLAEWRDHYDYLPLA
jgi:hypothetical protein